MHSQPAEGQLEGGVGLRCDRAISRLKLIDLGLGWRTARRRRRQLVEPVLGDRDRVDASEDGAELAGHHLARLRVGVVAQQTARDRLPLDALHQESGGAERVVAHQVHVRHRHTFLVRCRQQPVLHLARHQPRLLSRVHPQHQRQRLALTVRALDDGVERPRLSGSPARQQP